MLTIELCGKLADAGIREIAISIPADGMNVARLRQQIATAHPALTDLIASPRVRACVNDAIVDETSMVRMGDQVAFFPPVSGG